MEIKNQRRKARERCPFPYHYLGAFVSLLVDLLQELNELGFRDLGSDLSSLGHANQKVLHSSSLLSLDHGDSGH